MLPSRDLPSSRTDRRSFLAGIGAVTGLAAASQIPLAESALGAPRPRGGDYPFTLGVASGDPHPNGFVIWTRLVPRMFRRDGGMPTRPVPVEWKVARDERMRFVVKRGTVSALPGPRALGPRRAQRALPRPRVLLPVPLPARRVAGRPHPHQPRPRATSVRSASRSPPARTGPTASTRRTGTWRRRISTSSSTSATTSTSTAFPPTAPPGSSPCPEVMQEAPQDLDSLADAVRALQVRPRPAAHATPASPGSSPGTTTRSPTTTPAPTTRRSPRRAPRRTAPGTSTSPWAGTRCRAATARSRSTGDSDGAGSRSSTCPTRGSTARRRPAAGARLPSVTPAGTRRRAPCSARVRSAGCSTACAARTPTGTSWRAA